MFVKCPACGFKNFQGDDRCGRCFHTLMPQNIPAHKPDLYREALMQAPVSELLTGKDLLVADPADTIEKVVEILRDQKHDCVLIYKRKKLVGILSQRDLILRVAGKYQDLSQVKVEAVMTKNPEYVRLDHPIAYMVNKMALGGFRHVPVLAEGGTPVSIVSIKDVLKYLRHRERSR